MVQRNAPATLSDRSARLPDYSYEMDYDFSAKINHPGMVGGERRILTAMISALLC